MYHPDKYLSHNEALDGFCEAFNKASKEEGGLLQMKPSDVENFREDGKIVFNPTGAMILYDFEKRNKYYERCGFIFKDFGQFERKIQKPEILLSIQCSKDEKCFCIAWHEDFKKEEVKKIGSITGSGLKEYTGKRFTTSFREFKYSEMNNFYKILVKAFSGSCFNAQSFESLST